LSQFALEVRVRARNRGVRADLGHGETLNTSMISLRIDFSTATTISWTAQSSGTFRKGLAGEKTTPADVDGVCSAIFSAQ
jgi:hypothetical protein